MLDLYLTGLLRWATFVARVLPKEGMLADYMKLHGTREANIKGQELDQELAKSMGLD